MLRYMQIFMHKENKKVEFIMSNLQSKCHLKLNSKKWIHIEEARG